MKGFPASRREGKPSSVTFNSIAADCGVSTDRRTADAAKKFFMVGSVLLMHDEERKEEKGKGRQQEGQE